MKNILRKLPLFICLFFSVGSVYAGNIAEVRLNQLSLVLNPVLPQENYPEKIYQLKKMCHY